MSGRKVPPGRGYIVRGGDGYLAVVPNPAGGWRRYPTNTEWLAEVLVTAFTGCAPHEVVNPPRPGTHGNSTEALAQTDRTPGRGRAYPATPTAQAAVANPAGPRTPPPSPTGAWSWPDSNDGPLPSATEARDQAAARVDQALDSATRQRADRRGDLRNVRIAG